MRRHACVLVNVLKSVYFSAYLCLAFNIRPCEKKLLSLSHLLFGSSVESNRRSCIAELTFDLPGSLIRTRHRAVPCLLRLYSLHIINPSTISNFTLQRAPSQTHTHTHSAFYTTSLSLARRHYHAGSRFLPRENHLSGPNITCYLGKCLFLTEVSSQLM